MRKQVCVRNLTIKACGKAVRQMKSDPSALFWSPLHVYTSFISMEMVFVANCSLSLSLSLVDAVRTQLWHSRGHFPSVKCQGHWIRFNWCIQMSVMADKSQLPFVVFKKISESLMHYSGYYVYRHFRSMRMPPTCAPRNIMWSHDILIWVIYWFGSKRKMAQWSERAI